MQLLEKSFAKDEMMILSSFWCSDLVVAWVCKPWLLLPYFIYLSRNLTQLDSMRAGRI